MEKIGIIGGTFNPVHNGHLFIAEEARTHFGFSKVIFVPNRLPPHRSPVLPPGEHRWNMINLAVSDNEFFTASRVELEREGPSYTVDTVRHFSHEFPSSSLFFITGLDSLLEYKWYKFEVLIEILEGFIAVSRPGYSKELLEEKVARFYGKNASKILILDTVSLEISSTDIRRRLKEGRSVKYLLPASVEKYLLRENLYL